MNRRGNTLKLYLGCMFSGKSTSLLNEAQRYRYITENVIIVNHVFDCVRHDNEPQNGLGEIKTHDHKSMSALMVKSLGELYSNPFFFSKYSSADVVIIDEAQFYDDLYVFVKNELQSMDSNKTFIIGGLSGDFQLNNIGQLYQLVPLADEIVKLQAYCTFCKDGTKASFTKRLTNDSDVILVGKNDIYAPVCRYHYYV